MDPQGAGFAYGFGLFETIKFSAGRLALWQAHWARLQASANTLKLDCDFKESAVLDAIRSLIDQDQLVDSMIKVSLVRARFSTQLLVYSRPRISAPSSVELQLEPLYPLNPQSLLAGHKTHNYMENFAILEGARRAGSYDAIRLDPLGYLAETTIGNLFYINKGHICTPARRHGILPGVVRAALLTLHAVQEGSYFADQLQAAEAVFMTNSGAGVLPVSRVTGAGTDCSFESHAHPLVVELSNAFSQYEQKHSQLV